MTTLIVNNDPPVVLSVTKNVTVITPLGGGGPTGPTGVVTATPPLTYDAGTRTVSLDIGTGLEVVGGELVAASSMATDVEVAAAVSAHASASDPHGDRAYAAALAAAAAGFGVALKSGWWTVVPQGANTNSVTALGAMYASPVDIVNTVTIDRIAIESVVAGGASALARIGVYTDAAGIPGSLVADLGTQPANVVGLISWTTSLTLTPGRYWFTYVYQGSGGGASVRFSTSSQNVPHSTATPTTLAAYLPITSTGITGALPATFSVVGSGTVAPRFGLRAA